MGSITALQAQKGNQNRVNVYIDGQFAFGLAYDVAAYLRIGQVLSSAEIETLISQDDAAKAKESAVRFLSYRPRSQAEIQRHLEKKGYSEDIINQVIERLVGVDLLNDESFARFWVEQRETFKPRGHMALRQELQQKGIHREIIEKVLLDVDESAAIRQAANKKARQLTGLPEADFKRKLGQFLQRRGFSYEIIRAVTDEIWTSIAATESAAHKNYD